MAQKRVPPAYYVDDFKLYADIDATTVQFEDDFEGLHRRRLAR